MREQVLLPGEQLGDERDGEGLERPVAGHQEAEEPGEVASDKDRERNSIEVAATNKDPFYKTNLSCSTKENFFF